MVIAGAVCPECGFDGESDITDWIRDEDGYLYCYTIRCSKCERVWQEHYQNTAVTDDPRRGNSMWN